MAAIKSAAFDKVCVRNAAHWLCCLLNILSGVGARKKAKKKGRARRKRAVQLSRERDREREERQ
jgi:hypothetical protein